LIDKTISWEDPVVASVFEDKLVPLLKAGYFSEPIEWTMALDLWWGGDYGLFFMGSWITGMVEDPDDLGVFSLPECKGIVFAPDYAFAPAYTKYPKKPSVSWRSFHQGTGGSGRCRRSHCYIRKGFP